MTKKELDRIYKLFIALDTLYCDFASYGVKQLTNKKLAKLNTLCTRLFKASVALRDKYGNSKTKD
jgi:hypothetical protein